jgi:replicative DNA helicase
MGKTALALYINDYVAKQGKKALMFSLEMDGCQLFERQVSAYSKIPTDRLMRIDFGEYDLSDTQWGVIGSSMKGLSDLPIYIDDDPKLTVPLLVKKCKEFKEQHPDLALITIDYLTLMKMPDASRRDLAVGEATRVMKVLAKEIKTPILLLSQLNRDADKALREPRNSDLRDSGSIEQDADVIIFPYREEVHQPDTINQGLAKIIKSKVRNGKVGNHVLGFENGSFKQPFKEWQDEKPMEDQKFSRKKF